MDVSVGSSTAIVHLGQLVTNDPELGTGPLGRVADGALVLDEGRIAWVGPTRELPEAAGDAVVDAEGRCGMPGLVDSHSHLVFAGERTVDFVVSTGGANYSPKGIRSTVSATRAASTGWLAANATRLRIEALRSGTTTMETKSGYGLTVTDEERCCRVAGQVADDATFLGAHVVPEEFERDPASYVALVTGEMLRACAPFVRFVDVFCEAGAFDADQARAVLRAGRAVGLTGRVHANQLGHGPGVRVAVEENAASADHCTYLDDGDVAALASGTTVATLLPITEFATRTSYADGRRLLDAGARVAIASNCNPGSSYSSSMPFAIALAVREQGLAPDEAVRAATEGGAHALRRDDVGVLRTGARADVLVLEAPDPVHLAYRPAVDLVAMVWKDGECRRDTRSDRTTLVTHSPAPREEGSSHPRHHGTCR
jgi:imidazolonepropionase